jgi:hypothetical protein
MGRANAIQIYIYFRLNINKVYFMILHILTNSNNQICRKNTKIQDLNALKATRSRTNKFEIRI